MNMMIMKGFFDLAQYENDNFIESSDKILRGTKGWIISNIICSLYFELDISAADVLKIRFNFDKIYTSIDIRKWGSYLFNYNMHIRMLKNFDENNPYYWILEDKIDNFKHFRERVNEMGLTEIWYVDMHIEENKNMIQTTVTKLRNQAPWLFI